MSGSSPPPPPPGSGPPSPPGWPPAVPSASAPPPPPSGFYGPPQAPSGYAPQAAHHGGRSIGVVFIAAIAVVAVIAIAVVLLLRPPAPESPCREGEACNPPPPATLPVTAFTPAPGTTPTASPVGPGPTATPVGPGPTASPVGPGPTASPVGPGPTASPTGPAPTASPTSNAPPHVGGTLWRSESLSYAFEYDAANWQLLDEDEDYTELGLGPANFIVLGFPGTTSVAAAMADVTARLDNFILGRAPNTRSYDALLGPSIGYIRGDGAVYSGTLRNADGTPGDPVGITMLGSTNGQVTVVITLLVRSPDRDLGGDTVQAIVRGMGDNILKTFDWETGP